MSVLNDRTQGGSSLMDGSLELMVHRRLLYKGDGGDFYVNETGSDGEGIVVRGKHYLFFKTINESAQLIRDLSQRLFMSPIVSFVDLHESEEEYRTKWKQSFTGLSRELPNNVHLLTLENWKQNQILLRLEHFYESTDETELSRPVNVSLDKLFIPFSILNVTEMNLAANEVIGKTKRFHWETNETVCEESVNSEITVNKLNVRLSPQQIRTFVLTIDGNVRSAGKC